MFSQVGAYVCDLLGGVAEKGGGAVRGGIFGEADWIDEGSWVNVLDEGGDVVYAVCGVVVTEAVPFEDESVICTD